jgi:hypothetical protein
MVSLESSTELFQNTQHSESPREGKQSDEFFKSSVTEFLKKSHEMKLEFQKLDGLCKELSPKRMTAQRAKPASVDTRSLNAVLKELETKEAHLREANIEITRLTTELKSLRVVLKREGFYRKPNDSQEAKAPVSGIGSLDREKLGQDEARRSSEHRMSKLEQTNQELMHKLRQAESRGLATPSGRLSDREKSIFKAFLGRDFMPLSQKDSCVMGIIMMYEEQRQTMETEIHRLSQRDRSVQGLRTLRTGQSCELVKKLSDMLDCKATEDGVIAAVVTVLKVIQVLPTIEGVLKQACEIVLSPSQPYTELIPALQSLVEDSKCLTELELVLQGVKPGLDLKSYIKTSLASDLGGITLYRVLFKLSSSDNLATSVEEVFSFVHKLKAFLKQLRTVVSLHPDLS